MDVVTCWFAVSNVSRLTGVGGVAASPPGGQVGDRRCSSRPANGLYRRRAHDWDPGFRMESSLSGIKHAGAGALALSLPSASTGRAALRHPCSTPCRCSLAAPAAWPLTGTRVTYPCLSLCLSLSLSLSLSLPASPWLVSLPSLVLTTIP